jgi:drug/metabolite transporter (DMT)-like permease
VAVLGQLPGGLVLACSALITGVTMTAPAWGWGAVAAASSAVGVVFLYRGLGRGRMSVVAPLSGIGAAAVPVLVGIAEGERPGALAAVGLLLAVPAILLVAHVREAGGKPSGWPYGVIAGLGFGLNYVAIAKVPQDAGLGGLAVMQLGAAVLISLTLVGAGATFRMAPSHAVWSAAAGLLAALALLLFQVASHHGYLSETAVLSSLYPAATVILALVLLRERVSALQVGGFVLCAASICLIVSG